MPSLKYPPQEKMVSAGLSVMTQRNILKSRDLRQARGCGGDGTLNRGRETRARRAMMCWLQGLKTPEPSSPFAQVKTDWAFLSMAHRPDLVSTGGRNEEVGPVQ